jgi:hypothetical protein
MGVTSRSAANHPSGNRLIQPNSSQIKLYSLLYGELKLLLAEIDFGSGMEAAYTKGRQCIFERMQTLSPDQKIGLDALLTETATLPPTELQLQIRRQIYALLTPTDWQSITATALAAVELKLLKQVAEV